MPLIYLSYPEGTFTAEDLTLVVNQITRNGEELEGIPLTKWALSTTWVYARKHPKTQVHHGGEPSGNGSVTVGINVINGGISRYGNLSKGEPRRVYVIIREVAEANWGFNGQSIDLPHAC